jgi:hypothetical protein
MEPGSDLGDVICYERKHGCGVTAEAHVVTKISNSNQKKKISYTSLI